VALPRWPSLAAAAVVCAAASDPGWVLELENTGSGRSFRFAVAEGETFSVVWQHSMYDQPVAEEYAVGADGRILLRAVSSPSAAAREYLGITGPGERHAAEGAMREVVFRVAMGKVQRLRLGGAEHSFLEFGGHGDRLVMRAVRPPPAARPLAGKSVPKAP
jgi:hypothetical protein